MRRTLTTLLALLVIATVPAGAASASCLFDDRPVAERLDEFAYVFKGTVTELRDQDRTARFQVEEVWQGELGPEVIVFGGPAQGGLSGEVAATSVDRTWQSDTTYLVLARADDRGLVDDSCSPTRAWTDDLAAARPADWREPDPSLAAASDDADTTEDASGPGALGTVALAILGVAAIGGVAVASRRRRADAT